MNPLRQAAFVCLALAGIAIGYWAGYLTKGESPPTGQEAAEAPGTKNGTKNGTKPATKPAPTAPKTDAGISSRSRTAAPPLLPEKGIAQQVGPLRAYEEALPEDIIDDPAGPAVIAPSERSSDAKEDGPATPVRGKSIASWESPPAAEKSPDPPPEIPAETPKDAPKPTASKALPGADTPPQAPEQRDPPMASSGPPAVPAVPAVPRESGDLPAWKRFAVAVPGAAGRPRIAIVIDDLGIDKPRTARAIRLPGPLTLSFMTYATGLGQQTRDARSAGHELLMHIPMEPGSLDVDPGPNVLLTGVPRRELLASLNWNLDQFGGYVGVNNHMGSRFTADLAGMTIIMEVLKKRQLLFLDSLTASNSQAREAARKIGVPFAGRNVFLDHVDDVAAIEKRLHEVERLARRTGVAIAIGHPREATLQALLPWLKGIEAKGFQLIPLSAVLKTRVSRG